ncbi:uncharacterized protein LOC144201720 [Stigmatopora nigra]
MESRMTKPEVQKKTRPSKLPPWPPEPQKTNEDPSDKPVPVRPPRSRDNVNQNLMQSKTKEKNPELPVLPPRRMEQEWNRSTRHSLHESDSKKISVESVQSEGASTDIKEKTPLFATTKSEKRRKIKQSSFISHVTDTQDRGDDAADKQASASKPNVLKGVMKHLKPKVGGGGGGEALPDPDKDEVASEKERTAGDKTKREKSGEPKQDFGGRLAEMFWKSSVVTMGKADSDSEENDEDQKTSNAGKSVNKKFKKKAGETKSDQELSDSGDDLLLKPTTEEKGGFFSNILRKPAKNRKEVPPEQVIYNFREDLGLK